MYLRNSAVNTRLVLCCRAFLFLFLLSRACITVTGIVIFFILTLWVPVEVVLVLQPLQEVLQAQPLEEVVPPRRATTILSRMSSWYLQCTHKSRNDVNMK